jgi:hypothetical protein
VQRVADGCLSYEDELAVEAPDLVTAKSYERVCVGIVAPFASLLARLGGEERGGGMDGVMWAYQAS